MFYLDGKKNEEIVFALHEDEIKPMTRSQAVRNGCYIIEGNSQEILAKKLIQDAKRLYKCDPYFRKS